MTPRTTQRAGERDGLWRELVEPFNAVTMNADAETQAKRHRFFAGKDALDRTIEQQQAENDVLMQQFDVAVQSYQARVEELETQNARLMNQLGAKGPRIGLERRIEEVVDLIDATIAAVENEDASREDIARVLRSALSKLADPSTKGKG